MTTEIVTIAAVRALTDENIAGMNKADLAEHLRVAVLALNTKSTRGGDGSGRADEVLAVLREGPATIFEIAEKLTITSKNVSSQLCDLRKKGWVIHTDEQNRKYLQQDTPRPVEENNENPAE